jgi:phosphoribosylglycinamide formyltransferase 1
MAPVMGERVITVLASGRGSDLQSILDAVDRGLLRGVRVGLVVSDDPEAGALERARKAGVAAVGLPPVPREEGGKQEHERRLKEAVESHGSGELLVLAGYMRLLSARFVREHHQRVINIHPSLLPAFPGRDGPGDALSYGVRLAGCTTHFVDEGVDSGPVILQGAVRVHPGDDRDALHKRILALEHQLLPRTVDLWAQDRLRVEGRHVRVLEGDSWFEKVERIPEALYPYGF